MWEMHLGWKVFVSTPAAANAAAAVWFNSG